MKKVLILAYDFPPYISVGALRPHNWFLYFKEFEIEPIVITRQWNNKQGNQLDYVGKSDFQATQVEKTEFGTIFKTQYHPNLSNRILLKYGLNKFKLIRKIISGFYEFIQFILPIGPKSKIFKEAITFLKENKVDCIIATGDPYVLFKYANQLSRKFNVPWIADYRDPWSQGIHSNRVIIKKVFHFFEKKIVKNATLITTANTFFEFGLNKLFPNKRIDVVSNGYSDLAIEKSKNIKQQNEILSIAFAGTLYSWHPIESFLKVCDSFNEENLLKIDFYGVKNGDAMASTIETLFPNLNSVVSIHPAIQNAEIGMELSKYNVFLLFNDYSIIGTKIYTYLGLKRKILLCFTDDDEANILKDKTFPMEENSGQSNHLQADLIAETNSGIAVKDAAHLKVVLKELYDEFSTTGQIACNSVNAEKYSRKIQVKKLAELIHSIC